jgi:hypothetical protein
MRFSLSLGIDSTVSSNKYQWYKNNILYGSPTLTNQFIINNVQLTDTGTYTCKVTNPNMPLLTLDSRKIKLIAQTSPTSEADLCGTFKIVPNPTQHIVQIHCGGKLGEMITIYNDIGELMATQIATQEPLQLDLSTFQSGVYLVHWGGKVHKILKIN